MLIFLVLLTCSIIAGALAASRRRDVLGWGLVGFCFGVIGVLIIAVAAPLPGPEDALP